MRPLLIAITGGIGSGKSVVANMLRAMGLKVYDCDSRAKSIMDGSDEIREALRREICENAIDSNGCIDRRQIASVVFADSAKLAALNNIVHGAVRDDIALWAERHSDQPMLFIETAILSESGLDRVVDQVIEVMASERTRILRVVRRSGLSEDEVISRIRSQKPAGTSLHPSTFIIDNDGDLPVIPQLLRLLNQPT